jgi:hypothetical protein
MLFIEPDVKKKIGLTSQKGIELSAIPQKGTKLSFLSNPGF